MIFTKLEDGNEYAVVLGDDPKDIIVRFKDRADIKLTGFEAHALAVYLGCASDQSHLSSKGITIQLYHEQGSHPNISYTIGSSADYPDTDWD